MDRATRLKRLCGCYVTVPTMFKDDDLELDLPAMQKHVRFLIDGGLKTGNGVILAGGAAALPGVVASLTTLPVIGVPVATRNLNGLDSLLSIVQMPGGVPVGTLAIGKAGAINAALLAAAVLALSDGAVATALDRWRDEQTANVSETP